MEEIVKRLLRYRENNDLTFKKLAKKTDVPESNFYRWMRGEGKISRLNKKVIKYFLERND